jgi:hypothetical protein
MRTAFPSHSGANVAAVFHRLLALVFILAWVSLLWQVEALIGSRGLLPFAEVLVSGQGQPAPGFGTFPTLFLFGASDSALIAGIWVGLATGLVWLAGVLPRACAAVSAALYLSYATAAGEFLHFQWDSMLIECGALAALLPADRPAPWVHLLVRVLLFKLYFESGIAKSQSYLGDWYDGSAMTYYYETAPLPTWLAWYAHALPGWWHQLESRLVLVVEILVPLAIFGPRRARLLCAATLTAFQLLNVMTANYGFFCYLSLTLHVFLLDEADVARVRDRLPRGIIRRRRAVAAPDLHRSRGMAVLRRVVACGVAVAYVGISFVEALYAFAPPDHTPTALAAFRRAYAPFRVVNTYHLFGHITRERVEPELQTFDGRDWHARHLRYKPGDPKARPPFVAPHQPRVDFRLWFYGLSFRRDTPAYVRSLVQRVCRDPSAVESLFAEPLPGAPRAVRLVFWRYRFTSRVRDDPWWSRDVVAETGAIECQGVPHPR